MQRIWDPLYGPMTLSPFEWDFAFCPEVQRLRHVRLCNIDSLLIPGAAHVTRFEHALGVLRLANEWLATHAATPEESNNLKVAALVHDMQSGPFGHSIQYILEDNRIGAFEHEDLAAAKEAQYHQQLKANASYLGAAFSVEALCAENWPEVSGLIAGKGRLGKLISGAMDFDNIDNVVRLAFHVGICSPEHASIPIKLAHSIAPDSAGLKVTDSALPLIETWQSIRKRLYELLLLDWAEFAAKAMLTKAFEEAATLDRVGTDNWKMTDEELIQYFLSQVGESQGVKEICRRLRLGQLYTPILLVRTSSIELYKPLNKIEAKRRFERELRKSALAEGVKIQPLIHFILDVNKTERAVNVTLEGSAVKMELGRNSRSLLIGIFTSKPTIPKEHSILRKLSMESLSKMGCESLEAIPDPMPNQQGNFQQLALFHEFEPA